MVNMWISADLLESRWVGFSVCLPIDGAIVSKFAGRLRDGRVIYMLTSALAGSAQIAGELAS